LPTRSILILQLLNHATEIPSESPSRRISTILSTANLFLAITLSES
jgi:hypothetical protein